MKIRTDFVTNSSSSSFILMVDVRLKQGRNISFNSGYYCCETNGEIQMNVSPKQLGESNTVDELAGMLRTGIYYPTYGNKPRPKQPSESNVDGVEYFIQEIEENAKSMDDIASITVRCEEEYRTGHRWDRNYTYDRTNQVYVADISGGLEESEGTGGAIIFSDVDQVDLSPDCRLLSTFEMVIECDDGYKGVYKWVGQPGHNLSVKYSPKQLGSCDNLDHLRVMLEEEFFEDKEKPVKTSLIDGISRMEAIQKIEMDSFITVGYEQMRYDGHMYVGYNMFGSEEYAYIPRNDRYTYYRSGHRINTAGISKLFRRHSGVYYLFDDQSEAELLISNQGRDSISKLMAEAENHGNYLLFSAQLILQNVPIEAEKLLHVGKKVLFAKDCYDDVEHPQISVRIQLNGETVILGSLGDPLARFLLTKDLTAIDGRVALFQKQDSSSDNAKLIIEIMVPK